MKMKIAVIIAAAGESSRAGFPKLKAKIGDLSVLSASVLPFLSLSTVKSDCSNGFEDSFEVVKIVVTAPENSLADYKNMVLSELSNANSFKQADTQNADQIADKISFIVGGNSRMQTVYFALSHLKNMCETDTKYLPDAVLIHDGARPFVSTNLIKNVCHTTQKYGASVPVLPSSDSVYISIKPIDRNEVFLAQTPQGFAFQKLFSAYDAVFVNSAKSDVNNIKSNVKPAFTDDFSIFSTSNEVSQNCFISGEASNKKITFAHDLPTQVGIGYDIHRFNNSNITDTHKTDTNNCITLCGVDIPFAKKLVAHSDGDVVLHALSDAILSANGLLDIGHLFPDTDLKYKGASSLNLLKEVLNFSGFLRKYVLSNISITIIAEQPQIAPHIEKMKAILCSVLSLPPHSVGITATTNETVGNIGKGEAIAAQAAVSIIKFA